MKSALLSHPGLVRQNNEDCIRADDTLGVYLLADGMGGHNAGEIASALAVETVYESLQSALAESTENRLSDILTNAFHSAHNLINHKAHTSLSYMGMGTTLVAAVVRGDTAYVAHAGDSRAYHFRIMFHLHPSSLPEGEEVDRQLHRITNDHTAGDQLLALGVAKDQIPEKKFHTLTQSIGCGETPVPDCNTIKLGPGDMLLLCSDGLTDMLSDTEIEAILANTCTSFESLTGELINAANEKGGHDNVSVILIRRDK